MSSFLLQILRWDLEPGEKAYTFYSVHAKLFQSISREVRGVVTKSFQNSINVFIVKTSFLEVFTQYAGHFCKFLKSWVKNQEASFQLYHNEIMEFFFNMCNSVQMKHHFLYAIIKMYHILPLLTWPNFKQVYTLEII